jgi:hypothetical protein
VCRYPVGDGAKRTRMPFGDVPLLEPCSIGSPFYQHCFQIDGLGTSVPRLFSYICEPQSLCNTV